MENVTRISTDLSSKILTIGPDYHNHRGGIEAVIEIYNKYFDRFKFLPTFKEGSVFHKIIIFAGSLFHLVRTLAFDRKIKIIHIHGSCDGSFFRKFLCFIIAKHIFRKKIIYHVHGGKYKLFYLQTNKIVKKLMQLFINEADCIICLSIYWMNFLNENFSPKKIEIVPNIIDYPSLSNIKERRNVLTFLFLGKICQPKGVFDLLKVISENKERYYNKLRLIIGGHSEVEKLKKIIKQQDLERFVEFVGWVTNKEKTMWLQKADVFILPSYNEGLPIAILEAMSYGQPIISTNVGGIPEIVIPGRNGIIVMPGNLSQIEDGINFFIEHPEQIKDYGRLSKEIVKKYLPDSVIRELIAIYQLLLNH